MDRAHRRLQDETSGCVERHQARAQPEAKNPLETMAVHRVTYPHEVTIEAADGQTLLDASIQNRIPDHHQCGAHARCTTCRVQILDGLSHLDARSPLEERVASERG